MTSQWICKRCNHSTTSKGNLLSHLRRKQSCIVSQEDISVDILIKELTNDDNKKFSCPKCNTKLSTRPSLSRHKKNCNVEPEETKDKCVVDADIIAALQKQNQELVERLEQVERRLNTPHNQNITNNTQININVNTNNFGNEDTSYLSHDFLSHCLLNPRKGMSSLIENIHYNREYPNNQNLRCKSLKQNLFEKYIDSEWRTCDASNTLDELIKKGYRILNSHYTQNYMNDPTILEDENRQKIYERFRFLSDTHCNDYHAVKRELRVLVKDRTLYLLESPEQNTTPDTVTHPISF